MRACGSRSAELDSHPRVVHALGGAPGEAVFEAVGVGAREGHDGRGAGLQDRGGRGCRGPEDDGVGLGGKRKEARHGLVDERGAGDEDVVHLGEQVFAGGVGVVTLEDVAFEDVELGGVGHGGGREGEVPDDGDSLAGDEGGVGMEGARPVVFLAGAEAVGEGAYGVGVVGVDGRHADAGVLEVPGLGEGRDVAPTKPVTPGVLRTAPHDSSLSSMRTRM